ncbi:hypothetical protein [Streptacidiphilus neutrinimicus]|uniref:hypothetical protein n=1 Tax=Streptacidiphilus neutrinimicus TaxID=105420 RepID=UPI00191C090D|nr:hypothetical protein [Streptacidiphilus neutrinimicus]
MTDPPITGSQITRMLHRTSPASAGTAAGAVADALRQAARDYAEAATEAGGRTILELWVPAEELDEFNAHIVGEIQVVHEFRRPARGS